jgi:hypothetical protein
MANKGLLYGGTKQMKMLKKLLAVVLTGAMALTLLTACGSNAVTEKDIADVMSDMAKAEAEGTNVTFTPRAKEREMAQKLAALLESHSENDSDSTELNAKIKKVLGIDVGGVNEKSRYVWAANPVADGIGAAGQAHQIMRWILDRDAAMNEGKLEGTNPANDRYMGTALCKILDNESGKLVTVRVIVVTAEPAEEPAD